MILSGMSTMEQVKDNIATFEREEPVTPEEEAILLAAACAGVLGVLLVLRPGEGAQALTMLLGASLFLDGVMNLLVALLTVKIIRHQQPDVIETDEFEIK